MLFVSCEGYFVDIRLDYDYFDDADLNVKSLVFISCRNITVYIVGCYIYFNFQLNRNKAG